jgi:hydroxypyruvate isomerase
MKPAICLDPLFPGLAPEEKIERIAKAGFNAVDFWGWRDKNIPALKAACQQYGIQVVNFNGHHTGSPVAASTHPEFVAAVQEAVAAARVLDCHRLMLLTSVLKEDGSADPYASISPEEKKKNIVTALKQVIAETPQDMNFMLEALNDKIDHPGYFLTDIPTAADLVRQVGSPRLGVLCDLYHMGVMGYSLSTLIRDYLPAISYFHVADFPGRHEPGTGTADWTAILRQIRAQGFDGYISFEYFPKDDSVESLKAIRRLWDALKE